MKRIIALICMFCLLSTLVVPMGVAADDSAWDGWSVPNEVTITDGVAHFTGNGGIAMLSKTQAVGDTFTVSFSMKVNSVSGAKNGGFQIFNGRLRAGFYVEYYKGTLLSMDSWQQVKNPFSAYEWHDYTVEVDSDAMIQKIYVDGEFIGQHDLRKQSQASTMRFWSEGIDFEISDFVYTVGGANASGDLLQLTADYTEPFFQDFNEIGGWMVESERFVTHDPEAGTIRLRTWGDESHVYRSIERPLRPPANYDLEFRIKIDEPVSKKQGIAIFDISTDNRHTWLYVEHNRIQINPNTRLSLVQEGPLNAIPYTIGHDFNVWRAEIRGDNITWYINDKELVSFEMIYRSANRWHLCFYAENYDNQSTDFTLDWVKYTPYFEEELEMVAPESHSYIVEGTDVQLKAQPASDVEKVDYKINGVYVGSGYKKDNYVYTLKNAKVGVYNVTANIENIETRESVFYVKKVFEAELKADKENIKQGESVKVSVADKALFPQNRATKVEYFINGELAATSTKAPFNATLSGFATGTNSIFAKVYNNSGMSVLTEVKNVAVNYVPGKKLELGREYMLDYTYKSGNGNVEITDGYFKLALKHSADKVTYETYDGTQVYEGIGEGDYRVVVTAGYAELYYNNHMLVTFFMPRSSQATAFKNANVSNIVLGSSYVKSIIKEVKWSGQPEYQYAGFPDTTHYSVEFDKTDKSAEEVIFNDGTYVNKLSFREDGIYANGILEMYDPTPSEYKLADSVEPGYYRLTVAAGIAQLYRDNQYIDSYRCEARPVKTELKRIMTNPSASTILVVKNTDDLYYHTDTFEGNTEYSYEDYWLARPEHAKIKGNGELVAERKVDKNGNHYLNLSGNGSYMLNGIAQDVHLKWRGMVSKREGDFYINLRRSFGDRQERLGYDFEKGEWYYKTLSAPGTGSFVTNTVKIDNNALKQGVWYDFELICDGFDTVLYCDGKEVLTYTKDNSRKANCYGRVGFGVLGSEYNFDNFEYVGEGRVSPGFYNAGQSQWSSGSPAADYYMTDDGVVHAVGYGKTMDTTDGGRSWQNDRTYSVGGKQVNQIVKMPDGTLVWCSDDGAYYSSSYISRDDGNTWEGPYKMQEEDYANPFYNSVGRLTCTMEGRLFYVGSRGTEDYGHQEIYYSDDGINWNKSETILSTENTGLIYNESIVIDAPNGEVWFIARSNSGFHDYHISKDGGKTFDTKVNHLQLIAPECCFGVRRDWENPNTYYAIYIYDTQGRKHSSIQTPRCKTAISVSYDGMKTWEYLCDVMEGDEDPSLQTSDCTLEILGGTLYFRTTSYEGGSTIIGSQDISKAKTLKRAPQAHWRYFTGFDVKRDVAKDHCVLPKTDGDGWIYSDYYPVKVKDGMIDIETAARVFSVESKKTSNGVEFKMGDSVVKFTNNSAEYVINGETKTAETIILKGGYLDIKSLCDIYGKVFREAENSYSILDKAPAVDYYQAQIDELA